MLHRLAAGLQLMENLEPTCAAQIGDGEGGHAHPRWDKDYPKKPTSGPGNRSPARSLGRFCEHGGV